MNKFIKPDLLLIILSFFYVNVIAQDVFEVNLLITDTVIVAKKLIKKRGITKCYLYAKKMNAVINAPMLQDSVIFYSFNKYVHSNFFLFNDFQPNIYKELSIGLMYVIEDKEGKIAPAYFVFVSYKKEKDEIRNSNSRLFVTPKLRIERRLLTAQEQREYDLTKYIIHSEKESLELYPLLGEYHYNLPKGEYYLYFVYSNYNVRVPPQDMRVQGSLDNNVFRGYFVSNKVKLIVK